MFRLTSLLLAGIGLAMVFADKFPQPKEVDRMAAVQVSEVFTQFLDQPESETADYVVLASLTVEPEMLPVVHTIRKPVEEVVKLVEAPKLLPFGAPVVVDTDGKVLMNLESGAPVQQAVPVAVEAPTEDPIDVWYVSANRVNVREGPSTGFSVVDQVLRADAVQVLTDPENGWVKIRIEGDGVEGYMASRFLQLEDPLG